MNKNKGKFAILTIFSLLITVIGIILPYLNGKFIDYLTAGIEYKIIFRMSMLILVLGLINVVLYYVKQILVAKIKLESSYSMKIEIIEHLRNIPILLYKKYDPSYLNQRTEQDISEIISFITTNYPVVVLNAVQIIGLFFIIYRISKGLVALMLVFLPVYFIMYLFIRKPLYHKSYAAKEAQNSYFNTLNDQFAFMEEIRINANYEYNNYYITRYFEKYQQSYLEFVKISGKSASLEGILSALFQVSTFLYGGWQTLNGNMSVGELTVICTYFTMMLQLIQYYFELGNSFQNVKTSIHRLEEILCMETEEKGNVVLEEIKNVSGLITFGYDENNIFLKNVKLDLEPGKVCCLIGKNGSGKSTITKILIGILYANSLLINGIDINQLNMEILRKKKILYICQTLNYPNRTIKEIYQEYNLHIQLEDVLSEIERSDLNIDQLASLYRNNWDKNINSLSGGEKQIVSILKCLVKDANVIIFDEPTSNLDIKRTSILLIVIKHLRAKNKMVLVVTHDPKIMQISDSVLRIDDEF